MLEGDLVAVDLMGFLEEELPSEVLKVHGFGVGGVSELKDHERTEHARVWTGSERDDLKCDLRQLGDPDEASELLGEALLAQADLEQRLAGWTHAYR